MTILLHSSDADPRGRYDSQRPFLTGVQALIRLIVEQQRRDHATGRRTAGFVSGYEGSPLGGLDLEIGRRSELMAKHRVVHRPGVNEELAVTAVEGSQLASTRPDSRFSGVVGYWYGKAPGLDRATDALRHANLMGADPDGGAVAFVGDDPGAKSSTVASASEQSLADLVIPTLYPSSPQEVLTLGLHAVALSRASGLWSALKIVTAVADGGMIVDMSATTSAPRLPAAEDGAPPYRHTVTPKLLGKVVLDAEATAFDVRLATAREYARLNDLNHIEHMAPGDRIGIVAAGKTYLDVVEALRRLGLDPSALAQSPVRVLKLGMIYPLEPSIIEEFADGLEEIMVVEEKRGFLESAIKDVLFGRSGLRVVGKADDHGAPLFSPLGELAVQDVTRGLSTRFAAVLGTTAAAGTSVASRPSVTRTLLPVINRTPYFCSGCPHNSSTKAPEGALVSGGIGCHGMVLLMEPDQVGEVLGAAQMGGEGAHWIGMAPFVETDHLFQNLGDGTFHHSGSLAIRAAVAADSHITFKLLYNSAVAMTGGQTAAGSRTVPEIVSILLAEGVSRIIVTTEDRSRYRHRRLPRGVDVWDRSRLDEAQRALADTGGVTVLIHDQQCATEKRRDRKKSGGSSDEIRVVINERVCEGCGDCGAKSNCLSVQPVETDLGRKTRIHQTSCNTDYSCLSGDCPSFVTIRPARGKGNHEPQPADAVPEPVLRVDPDDFSMRITGIGGTGVVTVTQIVAAAAQLDGLDVSTLDQTGLSQKAGPVVSDLRATRTRGPRPAKLDAGACDLYLGCDVLVAADPGQLSVASSDRTIAVVSTSQTPTGRMVVDLSLTFPKVGALVDTVFNSARRESSTSLDAQALALEHLGDEQTANVLLLGAAFQAGALPLTNASLVAAIELNGTKVSQNLRAFELGREAFLAKDSLATRGATVHQVPDLLSTAAPTIVANAPASLTALVGRRAVDLVAYQNRAYARQYLTSLDAVWSAEQRAVPGRSDLTHAAAQNLYKLMAYKDEYEVARLCLEPSFRQQIESDFGPGARMSWNLHPPILRAMGLQKKIRLGAWARPILVALRTGRVLRGTPLDLFGFARLRRVERQILRNYRAVLAEICDNVSSATYGVAVRLAGLPDQVRGYEEIKLRNVEAYNEQLDTLRHELAAAR